MRGDRVRLTDLGGRRMALFGRYRGTTVQMICWNRDPARTGKPPTGLRRIYLRWVTPWYTT